LLPPLGETLSGLSHETFAAIPRYLRTLRSYIFLGPRKFFLRSEVEPNRFMSPWPFFLTNVSLGAALAATLALALDVNGPAWDWDLYKALLLTSIAQDVLLLPCGLIADWFALQRMSAETLLTAFAYASAWRVATMPSLVYVFGMLDRRAASASLAYIALAVLLAYDVYLILGIAAHNFMEGRARWSFALLTVIFFALLQGLVIFVFVVPADAREYLADATALRFTGKDSKTMHCDNAVINGQVNARGNDTLMWFEWGETPALGQRTPTRRYLDDGDAWEPLVNLRANTKYYYRIAVKSSYGVSHGKTNTLTTPDCTTPVAGSEEIE
jgi:hypothetical protein